MKTQLTTLICTVVLGITMNAQDVITFRNGNELKVKVLEVAPTEVKYKKFDNPEGPTYSDLKSSIFMIKYEGGIKDVFSIQDSPKDTAEYNDNYSQLNGIDDKNPDLIVGVNGERIACKITRIDNNTIYYHIFRRGADSNQSIAMSEVKNFTKDFKNSRIASSDQTVGKSETNSEDDFAQEVRKYGGPRIGMTFVGDGAFEQALLAEGKRTTFSQFGWQFEKRMFTLNNGLSGMIEFVPMVGGLDMGKFIPSVSGFIGIRLKNGFEFGAGPNLSIYNGRNQYGGYSPSSNFGIILAAGMSIKYGKIYFPINLAFVPSVTKQSTGYDSATGNATSKKYETGAKVTLTVGFNNRKR